VRACRLSGCASARLPWLTTRLPRFCFRSTNANSGGCFHDGTLSIPKGREHFVDVQHCFQPPDYSERAAKAGRVVVHKMATLLKKEAGGDLCVWTCSPDVASTIFRGSVVPGGAFLMQDSTELDGTPVVVGPHLCQHTKVGPKGEKLRPTLQAAEGVIRAASKDPLADVPEVTIICVALDILIATAKLATTPNKKRDAAILEAEALRDESRDEMESFDLTLESLEALTVLPYAQCHGLGSASGKVGTRKQSKEAKATVRPQPAPFVVSTLPCLRTSAR
jgi:hypothetical protein